MSTEAKKPPVIMNGRLRLNGVEGHCYIAANSKVDAERMLAELTGITRGWKYEIDQYFSPCWGDPMSGVVVERGVWFRRKYGETPKKVL